MKTETQIAKENVEELELIILDINRERKKVICQEHLATCQRNVFNLNKLMSDEFTEGEIDGNEELEIKFIISWLKDNQNAMKTYEDGGVK